MRRHGNPASAFGRIWRWPTVIAVLSIFGLLSALLGQGGIWWPLSWIALSIPLLVIVRCCVKMRNEKRMTCVKQ